jgi:hypothetical protein
MEWQAASGGCVAIWQLTGDTLDLLLAPASRIPAARTSQQKRQGAAVSERQALKRPWSSQPAKPGPPGQAGRANRLSLSDLQALAKSRAGFAVSTAHSYTLQPTISL